MSSMNNSFKNKSNKLSSQMILKVLPKLSPSSKSTKKKVNKLSKVKQSKKLTKKLNDLSFKDLNNHFYNHKFFNSNQNLKLINNDLEDKISSIDQTEDSSDESCSCSFDLNIQTSTSNSSTSSIYQEKEEEEEEEFNNLIECQQKITKTCFKKSFIEQQKFQIEQNKLNSTIMLNNNQIVNHQINCQNMTSQISNQINTNNQIISQNVNNQIANSQIDCQNSQINQLQNNQNYLLKEIDINNSLNTNLCNNSLTCNNQNTVSLNNLVNLANQFKMTNRVSAIESNQVNKLYLNSLNDKRKLTVQNNLIRQSSFCYSNNPTYPNYAYQQTQQQNSLERNNLKNLSTFLNRNKQLTNNSTYEDCYSDSEYLNTSNKFDYLNKKTTVKYSNHVELLNKNLNRPLSISQQNSPIHLNYKDRVCCSNKINYANWSKLNEQNQLNYQNFNQQLNQQLNQQFNQQQFNQQQLFNQQLNQQQQLNLIKTPNRIESSAFKSASSMENINNNQFPNDEILQINKQIDCLKSNLYWNDKKDNELNCLTTSRTLPSPNRLKQQKQQYLTNSNTNLNSNLITNNMTSLNNLTTSSSTITNDSNSTNLESTNSLNNIGDHSLSLPLNDLNSQLNRISPTSTTQYSLNELKKLRKDLQQSNQKVNLLTDQLNTNAQMVQAFQQNLFTMTNRIQQLTKQSNEKEGELNQLKLLINKLLDVNDLKPIEIDQLIDNLNKDEYLELNDKNSKIIKSKQLIRRHTFTSNEIQSNLNKCSSIENNSSNIKTKSNNQLSSDKDIDKTSSSWLKLTKAFKKTAKCSPIHKAINFNKNDTGNLIKEETIENKLDNTQMSNQLDNDTLLIISNTSSSNELNNNKIEEDEKLKKELNDKEIKLCELGLEVLNLKTELLNIKTENERLNKLIKDKSSLMSSKASLFSINSSINESSMGGNLNNNGLNNICNLSINGSNSSNCNTNIDNTNSINLINNNLINNNNLTLQSPSSDSIQTNNSDNTLTNTLTTTTTSTSSHNLSIDKNIQQIKINNLISPQSLNDKSYLDHNHFQFNNTTEQLNNNDNSIKLSSSADEFKNIKNKFDKLLSKGKLISIQLKSLNEKCNSPKSSDVKLDCLSNEIGLLRVSKNTTWSCLNQNLKQLIDDYLNMIDPNLNLGLNSNSIYSYELGNQKDIFYLEQCDDEKSEIYKNEYYGKQPFDYLNQSNNSNLVIKLRCKSMLESFVLQNLIPKSVILRITNLLSDKKNLILTGPTGFSKTYIAHKIAEYLIYKLNNGEQINKFNSNELSQSSSLLSNESNNLDNSLNSSDSNQLINLNNSSNSISTVTSTKLNNSNTANKIPVGSIATYYIDSNNCHNLHHYLNSIVQQLEEQNNQIDYNSVPTILIIDNLQFIKNIDETFSVFQKCKNSNYTPYIICTLNVSSIEDNTNKSNLLNTTSFNSMNINLQFNNNFRWLQFSNLNEPVVGFLTRFLNKKAVDNLFQKQYDYLSEFDLLEIDEKNLKDQKTIKSLEDVLDDLENKKLNSFKVINWLNQILCHINQFIENFSSIRLGPRILIEAPINDLDKIKSWFNQIWNNLIHPYLIDIIQSKPNLNPQNKIEDPTIFIINSYPFLSIKQDKDQFNLKRINLNEFRKHSNDLDPLVNALTNLNKFTNQ